MGILARCKVMYILTMGDCVRMLCFQKVSIPLSPRSGKISGYIDIDIDID